MQLYFADDLNNSTVTLDSTESHHIINVMRLGIGSIIKVTDGMGIIADAVITDPSAKGCVAEIVSKLEVSPVPYDLHIAIAPTKSIDRFEWFLEKVTEIGISSITPLLCNRSERRVINSDRLNKLMLSAAKQSEKVFFPQLNPLTPFKDFIKADFAGVKMIAHCSNSKRHTLKKSYHAGEKAVILIGPEGDFDSMEIDLAEKAGFVPISLGKTRLRTETAGVVACHSIAFINEEGDEVTR